MDEISVTEVSTQTWPGGLRLVQKQKIWKLLLCGPNLSKLTTSLGSLESQKIYQRDAKGRAFY